MTPVLTTDSERRSTPACDQVSVVSTDATGPSGSVVSTAEDPSAASILTRRAAPVLTSGRAIGSALGSLSPTRPIEGKEGWLLGSN